MTDTPAEVPPPGATKRTQVRRLPEKTSNDRAMLAEILDEGLFATVAITCDDQPYAVPTSYIRDGDELLLHGSRASRLFRAMAAGQPLCATVTLFDGLVYARSLFESSMQYRTAMVLGSGTRIPDDRLGDLLVRLADKLLPGHSAHSRHPSEREIAQTMMISVPLTETSVKIGEGPATDEDDADRAAWAGWIPTRLAGSAPVSAPDLLPGIEVPDYVLAHPLLTVRGSG